MKSDPPELGEPSKTTPSLGEVLLPQTSSSFGAASRPHYGGADNVADHKVKARGQALDVNDNDPMDDTFRRDFRTENEALTFMYFRLLSAAAKFNWPLDEMFFNGFGYTKEQGEPDAAPNHPITGHETHLHIGMTEADF